MDEIIKWTNDNSGFLALVLFLISVIYGWLSGMFNSLIKKPKLNVRFIPKMSFYSFYYTGKKWLNKDLNEEFELHKTGFVSYMSISNIGNKTTTIDKIWIGYYKSTTKRKWLNKNNIQWLTQWHPIDNFMYTMTDGSQVMVNNLRVKNNIFDNIDNNSLEIGKSLTGVAYFEQETAWGNFCPFQNDDRSVNVTIKIRDIYGKYFRFKTKLKQLDIEDARKFNPNFANIEQLIPK